MSNDKCSCSETANAYIDFLTNNYLSYDDMYQDMVKSNVNSRRQMSSNIAVEKEEHNEMSTDNEDMMNEDTDFSDDVFRRPIGINIPNYSRYEDDTTSFYLPKLENKEEEQTEEDINYMKSMYPSACRKVLKSVEEECDKLEYAGSCMFDEYPDRTNISRIIIRIYENVKDLYNPESEVETQECNCCYGRYCPYSRCVDCCEDGTPNWLYQMIQALFYQEMIYRRRRYRFRNWR